MNGILSTEHIALSSSTNIVFCFFINCSTRAITLENEGFLKISYSTFQNCSDFSIRAKGGAIKSDTSYFQIKKCRFDACGSYIDGNTFYSLSNAGKISELSISQINSGCDSHYILSCNVSDATNINATHCHVLMDVGIICRTGAYIKFLHLEDLSGRTLFRTNHIFEYCNAIKATVESFLYNTITCNYFYFSDITADTFKYLSEEVFSYPATFSNCIFVNTNIFNGDEAKYTISNSKTTGTTFLCLDRIPMEITCKNQRKPSTSMCFFTSIYIFGLLV